MTKIYGKAETLAFRQRDFSPNSHFNQHRLSRRAKLEERLGPKKKCHNQTYCNVY